MIHYVREIIGGQFGAALAMLEDCIRSASPEQWESKIAAMTCRQVAYHTLFFVDFYLSPSDEEFQLRELHQRGGDEHQLPICPGLSQEETLSYAEICRRKLSDALAAETAESLAAPAKFSRRKFSRGELYLYNLRHVQHHTGQLGANLRRLDPTLQHRDALPWIGTSRVD